MKRFFSLLFCVSFLVVLPACKKQAVPADEAIQKAKVLIAQGHYTEAFLRLNQVLSDAPNDPNIHLNLGWLYLYTNNLPKVANEIQTVEHLSPNTGEFLYLKGAFQHALAQQTSTQSPAGKPLLSRQSEEKAIRFFQEALKRSPKNPSIYFDLATSLSTLNRDAEAVDILDQGFDVIPKQDLNMQVNFEMASCATQIKLEHFDDAIAECTQAAKYAQTPAAKARIQEMIENLKLLNP